MTCGPSEPWATVGDRYCPCGTVVTRTQRGPSSGATSSTGEISFKGRSGNLGAVWDLVNAPKAKDAGSHTHGFGDD
jgi:hypothetical protein